MNQKVRGGLTDFSKCGILHLFDADERFGPQQSNVFSASNFV